MKNKLLLSTLLVVLFATSIANAKPPHQGYIDLVGWGGIAVTNTADPNFYPPFQSFDASQYKYKNGVNYVKAGQPFAMRVLFKDGKTLQDLVNDYKKKTGKDAPHYQVTYWTSHDKDGVEYKSAASNWPKNGAIPSWTLFANGYQAVISDRNLAFQGSAYAWNQDTPFEVKQWVETSSKPGYKLYVAVRFRSGAADASQKYWNKNTGQWVTPTMITYSDPIATTTIAFE